jgi:hypothetical protein
LAAGISIFGNLPLVSIYKIAVAVSFGSGSLITKKISQISAIVSTGAEQPPVKEATLNRYTPGF